MFVLNTRLAPDFPESIGIKLSSKTFQVAVLEVDRQNVPLKLFHISNYETVTLSIPAHQLFLVALKLDEVHEHLYKLVRLGCSKTVLGVLVDTILVLR